MNLGELQTYIGVLTNDPSHDRYSLSDINTELDGVQDEWNLEASVLEDTVSVNLTANVSEYDISNLTGTPIAFNRATHKGIPLDKKSEAWLDLYAGGHDWTTDIGVPKFFFVDVEDPDDQSVFVYPLPQSGDVDRPVVLSYVKRHTPMSSSTDSPFNANTLLVPYHDGIAFHASARLLLRDPSPGNNLKVYGPTGVWGKGGYSAIAMGKLDQVIEVFKSLGEEEPKRFRGGRYWNSGTVRLNK